MGGLLGGLLGGGEQPMPKIAQMSPEQQKTFDSFNADSIQKSAGDIYKTNSEGMDKAIPDAFMGSEQENQKYGVPGGAGIGQAIQNKYSNLAGVHIGRMKDQLQMQSEMQRAQRLSQSHNLLYAKQQMDIQNAERLQNAQNAANSARSKAIGGLFQGAGMIAGAAIGGGVPGALIGGAAGGVVGNLAGGLF